MRRIRKAVLRLFRLSELEELQHENKFLRCTVEYLERQLAQARESNEFAKILDEYLNGEKL